MSFFQNFKKGKQKQISEGSLKYVWIQSQMEEVCFPSDFDFAIS